MNNAEWGSLLPTHFLILKLWATKRSPLFFCIRAVCGLRDYTVAYLNLSLKLSAIIAMNSEFVGFPRVF